jgi:hypothetical protein
MVWRRGKTVQPERCAPLRLGERTENTHAPLYEPNYVAGCRCKMSSCITEHTSWMATSLSLHAIKELDVLSSQSGWKADELYHDVLYFSVHVGDK